MTAEIGRPAGKGEGIIAGETRLSERGTSEQRHSTPLERPTNKLPENERKLWVIPAPYLQPILSNGPIKSPHQRPAVRMRQFRTQHGNSERERCDHQQHERCRHSRGCPCRRVVHRRRGYSSHQQPGNNTETIRHQHQWSARPRRERVKIRPVSGEIRGAMIPPQHTYTPGNISKAFMSR